MDEWVLNLWHDELNKLCFDHCLPRGSVVSGLSRYSGLKPEDYEACYTPDSVGSGTIFLNPAFCKDIPHTRACLAHEMIHQWQDLCGLRLDHRAVFKAWAQHITNLTGLVP
jgi:hypothetical protein